MEVVREWLEPVVRVQTLADAASVPERYVKPPSERPNAASDAAAAASRLPVIDLGGLRGPGREETMRAVAAACREWGFFQAVNHGVPAELVAEMRRTWREFFARPMEEKQAYANSPATFEGYGSRLGVKKGAILDWGDYFFLQLFPAAARSYDKWPAIPPSLRETTEAYGEAVRGLCEELGKVLSASLGLEEGFLRRAFGEAGAGLRVNYYPRCPQPELTLGLSAHSDPGGITVLLADADVRGLQVRGGGGAWITVDPVPGALIVNVGDQIEILTNAMYKSVEHRVVVNAAVERLSFAFFYSPQDDLPIEPAERLVSSDRPAMYRSKTFREYKLLMRMLGPGGKSHVDSIKAT